MPGTGLGTLGRCHLQVSYLRCHLADVTVKVHAERELRLRTLELAQVNEQLRRINRELEELKDRYTDLYENAPAMYFSLDSQGRLIECNQAFLTKHRQAERGPLDLDLQGSAVPPLPPLPMTPATRPDWYSSSRNFSRAWLIALMACPRSVEWDRAWRTLSSGRRSITVVRAMSAGTVAAASVPTSTVATGTPAARSRSARKASS